MEIDDILESLEDNVTHFEHQDLKALTRAWVTERGAPEILPWPSPLMERVLGRIRKQVYLPTIAPWTSELTTEPFIRLSR